MDINDLNGKKLRALRESLGWTREHLSEKADVPVRTIYDIESGDSKNPGLETVKQIVKAMEKNLDNPALRHEIILEIYAALVDLDYRQLRSVRAQLKKL